MYYSYNGYNEYGLCWHQTNICKHARKKLTSNEYNDYTVHHCYSRQVQVVSSENSAKLDTDQQ